MRIFLLEFRSNVAVGNVILKKLQVGRVKKLHLIECLHEYRLTFLVEFLWPKKTEGKRNLS